MPSYLQLYSHACFLSYKQSQKHAEWPVYLLTCSQAYLRLCLLIHDVTII